MKIDLSCPVELWQYSLPTESAAECTFVLNNLSDKIVVSVQVTLLCYGPEQALLFKQTERVQGLCATPGERFSVLILPTAWEGVASVDLIIEKVWFDDAVIWRRGSAALTEYQPNALAPSRKLDMLKFVAGPDAVGYPDDQGAVWLCVCGRANSHMSNVCCRCERQRDTVFASFGEENIRQLIAMHESRLSQQGKRAREDASRLTEQREVARERTRLKRRRRARIIALCVAGAAAVAAFVLWGVPALRYAHAGSLFSGGKYVEARAAFAAMGDYGESAAMLPRCDYAVAESELSEKTQPSLQSAIDHFTALGDYEDSADKALLSTYELGKVYQDAGDTQAAIALYEHLGDYGDCKERILACRYADAEMAYAAAAYADALAIYDALDSYQDSADKALRCHLELGRRLMDASDWEAALAELESAGELPERQALEQQTAYALGQQYENENRLREAGEMYLRAGDIEDAKQRADNALYQAGVTAMESGDYEAATEIFALIPNYLDAESRRELCVLALAQQKEENGDTQDAYELYASLPQSPAATLGAERTLLALGKQALESEQYAVAEQLLSPLEGGKEANALLAQARYAQALALMDAQDYAAAEVLLQKLGKHEQSESKRKECLYQLGVEALESGAFADAAERLGALSGYADSDVLLAQALTSQARQALDEEDADTALALLQKLDKKGEDYREIGDRLMLLAAQRAEGGDASLYLSLGDYDGAKDAYNECIYQQAAKSRTNGNYVEATELFLTVRGYMDADEQAASCYNAVYGDAARAARSAMKEKDYKTVIDTLDSGMDLDNLPSDFRDLRELRLDAIYAYAEQLYDADKPYEALSYYQMIPDHKDVSSKKLKRRCYLLLGQWQTDDGKTAVFRPDNTCDIMGEKLCFQVDNYVLMTGESMDALEDTHKLTYLTQKSLTLRDLRGGKSTYAKFTRVVNDAPADTPSEVTEEGDDAA